MKIFAFFLPQFHEIPENNEWWGEGFTEWVNVKKAKPLFSGHQQPKTPLHQNYYNLLERKTMEWQTQLMHEYGVDGMIYYHYYFKGKKLLEKPCENLLKWKELDQKFFFCWANHSWIRSWNGTSEMLLEQTYGTQEDWEAHFQYLLPFFRDERYEKKANAPLFALFQLKFPEKEEMFRYLDQRCKDEGFSGLYLIETFGGSSRAGKFKEDFDAFRSNCTSVTKDIMFREPANAIADYQRCSVKFYMKRVIRKIHSIMKSSDVKRQDYFQVFDGNKLFGKMMETELSYEGIKGLFFEWDNTPRHGKRGYVITPVSRDIFFKYMDAIKDEEYVFVNAWNEWAEGMILEPTEENGYSYLEMIRDWRNENTKNRVQDSFDKI